MKTRFFICLFFLPALLFAKTFLITGTVTDRISKQALAFANIRVKGTTLGTSSNEKGEYILRLPKGKHKLIASFIGYKSDTVSLNLTTDIPINFKLLRTSVRLDEITVLPGENPALAIIRKTIKTKQKRNEKLLSYKFKAYTKGIVKTTQDISVKAKRAGLSLGIRDTAKLKITGILENESIGVYKKPDNYKEEITARKQTSNFPSSINMLTGGRIIQNFYAEDIQFFGRYLVSPIADDALDFYYYYIEDTIAIDNSAVFKIKFEPDYKSNPGFYGYLFITDKTFNLIKLDINLNDAANPGGIFSKVNIVQQYLPYADSIYMPIDYRLFVKGNVLGMAKFAFDIESVLYDYEINPTINDDFFDMTILKILPEADKVDKTYWEKNQKIPNSPEEISAYKRIDSLEAIPLTFADRFTWLSTRIRLSEKFSTVGTMSLYRFNKVEGHTLNGGLYYDDFEEKRLKFNLDFNYGFSDKKWKGSLWSRYLFGKYRTTKLTLSVFDNLNVLFEHSDDYGNFLSTLTSLFAHYEFRDYYYSNGFKFNITAPVLPVLNFGFGISNRTDKNTRVNSEYSFFNKDKFYDPSKKIFEGKIVTLSADFKLDFRKFIEDGYFRRRTSMGKSYFTLAGKAVFSNKSKMTSNLDFQIYSLNFFASINSFKSTKYIIEANGFYATNAIPFQMMTALPGNLLPLAKDETFRTINLFYYMSDRAFTVITQYRFNDELFKMLHIPLLKDWRIKLDAHFNIALTEISQASKQLNQFSFNNIYKEFNKPLYEIGFGIGHQLIPLKIEFTWRLTHRNENSFVIGINSVTF